jgi:hypothetical protein
MRSSAWRRILEQTTGALLRQSDQADERIRDQAGS